MLGLTGCSWLPKPRAPCPSTLLKLKGYLIVLMGFHAVAPSIHKGFRKHSGIWGRSLSRGPMRLISFLDQVAEHEEAEDFWV